MLAEIRYGACSEKGSKRYGNGHTNYSNQLVIEPFLFIQHLRRLIVGFPSVKGIYDYVIKNDLWFRESKEFKHDLIHLPSVSANIAAGFVVRNFEINNYHFIINEKSFAQALGRTREFF